jgi:solute carrier family 35 (UDP-xylose/UDP-N-acetylglucosamine transporter), member B4
MFFLVSVINNYALNFNISMPLHMIFRSGSLIANMLLGMVLLNKRYQMREYISVFLITIGITLCTFASSTNLEKTTKNERKGEEESFIWLVIGLFMLTFALFLSAGMGLIQESLYKKYGKHPNEALFYNVSSTLSTTLI